MKTVIAGGPVAWRPELGEVMGQMAKSLANRGLNGGNGLFPFPNLMWCTLVLIMHII